MSFATRIECALIRLYQAYRFGRPSPCRFVPSCSVYAVDSLTQYGCFGGNRHIVARLVRCRPWGPFGADPVPLRDEFKRDEFNCAAALSTNFLPGPN